MSYKASLDVQKTEDEERSAFVALYSMAIMERAYQLFADRWQIPQNDFPEQLNKRIKYKPSCL